MTEQEYYNLIDEVSTLYKLPQSYILSWAWIMPLAINEGLVNINELDSLAGKYIEVSETEEVAIEGELYKDHPTKERAVAVAILRALKAKKEK